MTGRVAHQRIDAVGGLLQQCMDVACAGAQAASSPDASLRLLVAPQAPAAAVRALKATMPRRALRLAVIRAAAAAKAKHPRSGRTGHAFDN
mmetsp:Transcript_79489/g.176427  ORF Transcript_79489/g.176427 Transcript_79489/m.176427 type:complete len:91 (-) Transcript_79489:11-283(-)